MKKIIVPFLLLSFQMHFCQVGINTNNPKATLDIIAKDPNNPLVTDGILVPRVSVNPSSGSDVGQLIYNTTLKSFQYWTGTVWAALIDNNSNANNSVSVNTNSSSAIIVSNTDTTEKLLPGLSKAIVLVNPANVNFIANINFSSSSSAFQPKFGLKITNNTTSVKTEINKVSETYMSDGTVTTTGNLLLGATQNLAAGSYIIEVYAFYENCCPYAFSYTSGGTTNSSSLIINTFK